MMRKRILVMADWFEPAYKAGGPIRSVVNFAEYMRSKYDIYVLTGDRDINETIPYKGIISNEWIFFSDGVKVFYASPECMKWKQIKLIVDAVSPDYVYCNSMFSKPFTIYPLLMKRFGMLRMKVVLSPRGMLKASALAFKPKKKQLFLKMLQLLQIEKYIHFHATDNTEVESIKAYFKSASITKIPNFSGAQQSLHSPITKSPGSLRMVFIGRLHPLKNLHYLLELLKEVKGEVLLSVIGPTENKEYLNSCYQLIKNLPDNIKVDIKGEMPHNQSAEELANHHIFVLPTKGENFGHAIFEALSFGKPVVISDQTPWRNLAENGAGWDISLKDKERFISVLNDLVDSNDNDYSQYSLSARRYLENYIKSNNLVDSYQNMFPIDES